MYEVKAATVEEFRENWYWIRPILDKIAVTQKALCLAEDVYMAVMTENATAVMPVDGTHHIGIMRELKDAEGTFIWLWAMGADPRVPWSGYYRDLVDLLKARGFSRIQFESARPSVGRIAVRQGFHARAVVYEQKFDLG